MADKEEWRWVCVDAGSRLDGDSDEEEEEEDEEYDPTRVDEDGLLRPLTRWGQTLACLPSSSSVALSFFLYGGRDGRFADGYIYPREVWTCSLKVGAAGERSVEWRCGPLVGDDDTATPKGRFLHSTCVVGRGLLVWGGHDDEDVFDDLHLLDTDTMQWRRVECEGESPGPRYAAESVTLADDLVLVYGGKDDSKAFNDLHLLRFTSADKQRAQWSKLAPTGQAPTPRDCGTATLLNKKLYVIGGSDEEREVFVYDVETNAWSTVAPPEEGSDEAAWPTLRSGHACAPVAGRYIVMFGGCTPEALHGDTHVFDTEQGTWRQLSLPEEGAPARRAGHSIVALADARTLALFGGETVRPDKLVDMATLNDLHLLQLSS